MNDPQTIADSRRNKANTVLLYGWTVLAWFAAALASYGQLLIGYNNDNMTLMFQTTQMVNGAKLYVDYVDVSPPMIHLLYSLPVMFAKATGIIPYVALKLFALVICYFSLWQCWEVLRASTLAAGIRNLIVATVALVILGFSFQYQLYADREHLMITMIMPLVLLYSPVVDRRALPRWLRITVGITAGIGLAIKPYFYVFYAVILLFTLLRERRLHFLWRDIETYMIGSVAVIYLAVVLLVFPAYVKDVLPLGMLTYKVISWGWMSKWLVIRNDLVLRYGWPVLVSLLALLFMRGHDRSWVAYTWLLLLAGIGSYLLNAGWRYTQYPFLAFAGITIILATAQWLAIFTRHSGVRWRLLSIAAVTLCAWQVYTYATPTISRARKDIYVQKRFNHPVEAKTLAYPIARKLYDHFQERPSFMLLSTTVWASNIMQQLPSGIHVGRYDYLWMLPGIVSMEWRGVPAKTFLKTREEVTQDLVEDLNNKKPDIIILDRSQTMRALPNDFDIVRFFSYSPEFREALSHYHLADQLYNCPPEGIKYDCFYHILYRNEE